MALGLSPQEIIEKGEYQLLAKASHWERVLLADIADVQNGFAFKSELFDRHEGVPLIRIRDISRCETEDRYKGEYDDPYLVHRDDILVGMDGDFIASYWKGDKALLNQRVCKLVVRSKNFDAKFFFLCLQPFLSAINAETSSVTVKHLSSRTIETIPLPLPPLNEQRRIVAEIETIFSELDNGVESLKTAQEQLQVYRRALLKHAFEGKMTADWRAKNAKKVGAAEALRNEILDVRRATWEKTQSKRYKIPVSIDPVDLPPLPCAWGWVSLDELVSGEPRSLQSGPFGSSLKHSEFQQEGMLVIGIDNVGNGQFSLGNQNRLPTAKFSKLIKYQARPGDLLITVMASLGRTCVVPRSLETAIITKHVYRVSVDQKYLLPEFYNLALQGPTVSRRRMLQGAQGQTRPGLNSSILREIPLPLCSLAEQQEVVSRLSQRLSELENLDGAVQEELLRAEVLRQSILKKAFLGCLVGQDQNDEPASVLLQRIRGSAKGNGKRNIRRKGAA